ncbi:MAG: M28 family peptidase [Bdellovibrio sp.]|nr:M28 family peptidase [Bdellovibrio sp.]
MKNLKIFIALFATAVTIKSSTALTADPVLKNFIDQKNTLIADARQITFVGPRSGEGYFSADGKKMIFQSEREPGNPFYQMYILDLKSGQTSRVSTGQGKTTCGWIKPDMKKVMWSSTHLDSKTKEKIKGEYAARAKPVKGRYSWSFDDQFDIFESDLQGKNVKRLTKELGYDAEGSYSPDGQWIAFASNRSLYSDQFTEDDKKVLQRDPSYAMEIYIMKADGTQVKRLTNSLGYDGGPFFSADGKKITWRRFNADGSKAEIYTMNVDGSEQKQITSLGSMSWAPFFHPSGKYIIFGSSVLGYSNFELFIVDSEGKQKPVRVTFADGFDGLASFSPDGQTLTWSHRNEKGDSQIYLASWNHDEALKLLNLSDAISPEQLRLGSDINEKDVRNIVSYLASEKMQGRATGSAEEKIYSTEIARLFKSFGLRPAFGDDFIQAFEFTSGVSATENNTAELKGRTQTKLNRGDDYQVLSYSKVGDFQALPIAFAGYGIVAPATDKLPAYDSFKELDVKGKWVLVLDHIPELPSQEMKHNLLSYSRPQHKITVAKNRGAAGVIFISETSLKDLKFEGSLSESTVPVIKISSKVIDQILKSAELTNGIKSYDDLKTQFETSKQTVGFTFNSEYLSARIDLNFEKSVGRNVIAVLEPTKKAKASKAILIGAHGDHLGLGERTGSSLARAKEKSKIHFGADDNASGVAGVIELSKYFSEKRNEIKKPMYFAVWSGEEVGVLGSSHFVKVWKEQKKSEFSQSFEAGLNMDMIGRLRDQLQVQGVASAKQWVGLSEEVALISGVPLAVTADPYLPTDAMSVYVAGVPSISFFTGSHEEYHTPRDTAETLNYPGLVRSIGVVKTFAEKLVTVSTTVVKYEKVEGNSGQRMEGRSFRIYLGTIPDYSQEGVKGVRVSGASKNSPAEKAGVKTGDIIIEFAKTKIENLYDYVYTLQAVKPNILTKMSVMRDGKKIDLDILPLLKE